MKVLCINDKYYFFDGKEALQHAIKEGNVYTVVGETSCCNELCYIIEETLSFPRVCSFCNKQQPNGTNKASRFIPVSDIDESQAALTESFYPLIKLTKREN